MFVRGRTLILEYPVEYVKSPSNNSSDTLSDSVIHHKVLIHKIKNTGVYYKGYIDSTYGVSPSLRVLSPQILLKRIEYVRQCLTQVLGLTPHQREVAISLLRLWAYYGKIYPKQATVSDETGASKATYWRTIKYLQHTDLIAVVNRFLIRPHAQISNLYNIHKLVALIARYLAEHGGILYTKWLEPVMRWPACDFLASLKLWDVYADI